MQYVIYHRQAGYLVPNAIGHGMESYTDDSKDAQLFDTREKAKLEIASYQEQVVEIE